MTVILDADAMLTARGLSGPFDWFTRAGQGFIGANEQRALVPMLQQMQEDRRLWQSYTAEVASIRQRLGVDRPEVLDDALNSLRRWGTYLTGMEQLTGAAADRAIAAGRLRVNGEPMGLGFVAALIGGLILAALVIVAAYFLLPDYANFKQQNAIAAREKALTQEYVTALRAYYAGQGSGASIPMPVPPAGSIPAPAQSGAGGGSWQSGVGFGAVVLLGLAALFVFGGGRGR